MALRYWLKQHNLTATEAGGGDVPITPVTPNSAAVLQFTDDPIASSLITAAQHAAAVGLLDPISNLGSIFDLDPLNKLLSAAGEQTVSSS